MWLLSGQFQWFFEAVPSQHSFPQGSKGNLTDWEVCHGCNIQHNWDHSVDIHKTFNLTQLMVVESGPRFWANTTVHYNILTYGPSDAKHTSSLFSFLLTWNKNHIVNIKKQKQLIYKIVFHVWPKVFIKKAARNVRLQQRIQVDA